MCLSTGVRRYKGNKLEAVRVPLSKKSTKKLSPEAAMPRPRIVNPAKLMTPRKTTVTNHIKSKHGKAAECEPTARHDDIGKEVKVVSTSFPSRPGQTTGRRRVRFADEHHLYLLADAVERKSVEHIIDESLKCFDPHHLYLLEEDVERKSVEHIIDESLKFFDPRCIQKLSFTASRLKIK
jgi:hypothetical protein